MPINKIEYPIKDSITMEFGVKIPNTERPRVILCPIVKPVMTNANFLIPEINKINPAINNK